MGWKGEEGTKARLKFRLAYKFFNVVKNEIGNVAKMDFNIAINGFLMSHKNGFSMSQKVIF